MVLIGLFLIQICFLFDKNILDKYVRNLNCSQTNQRCVISLLPRSPELYLLNVSSAFFQKPDVCSEFSVFESKSKFHLDFQSHFLKNRKFHSIQIIVELIEISHYFYLSQKQ